ncbi:MAG: aldehyde dehydrogenase family protein [Fimbriimonadaceae bacterium]|nr:aldehyde dehydrogenase family protein [Fimbriimonadaceae bacterium]
MILHEELLIGGTFFGGPCDSSIPKQIIHSPFDGARVGVAAEAGWGEADAAIEAAVKAHLPWSRSSRSDRQGVILACASALREHKAELCDLMALEIGKPVDVAAAEIDRSILTFELAATWLETSEWESIDVSSDPRSLGAQVAVRHESIGPVFCITPFNWPINLAAHKIAPALAAGNSIILKGSPQAALCTLRLARILHEAGVPHGVLNALHCEPDIAERIATDPRVRMISFTGSEHVGWYLKEKCWDKRVTLELGGTACIYIHSDTDISKLASKIAASAFTYSGQICISTQTVYAHFDAYDALREALIEATQAIKACDPRTIDCICGPVISEDAAVRITTAIAESGGTILAGGTREKTLVQPTLIEAPYPSSDVVAKEIFGPVLNLQRVDVPSLTMVELARSPYGIQHSVFTQDERVVEQFLKFVPSGSLVVNDVPSLRFDAMPYGGVKRSGFGREGVRYAIEEMTELRAVIRRVQP